jgi:NADH:ubiquinone oxidoreductase subunit H
VRLSLILVPSSISSVVQKTRPTLSSWASLFLNGPNATVDLLGCNESWACWLVIKGTSFFFFSFFITKKKKKRNVFIRKKRKRKRKNKME